ncbi:hypothetical protein GNIT_2415 [Glaciecola nitratireducens FR1064]|uniref:Uncharacterized protein n=1 Tax=Glaciecola nitratireducens (strain JCM 12485 / KCTC 12276 / FR1064) TaxID=1085623 RepID=G4QHX9_GLANF|nr:hypothetical protein GNIT_2415 [Glaciecola nitratireducens FR1064]
MRASQGCARSAFLQDGCYSMLWIQIADTKKPTEESAFLFI